MSILKKVLLFILCIVLVNVIFISGAFLYYNSTNNLNTQDNYSTTEFSDSVEKPFDLYLSQDECNANSKFICLESRCTKGQPNGSRLPDGTRPICSDTWEGWIPVNEVLAN